ncbi:ragulator complex protein LAMTOR5 homolog [Xenia sp. Carnegie-2017]|uniref:ragulator complex protein LAMTOR5 homolog n=1 Tax=Xenia sp. Carnegie-2017 TaxID=2897299 RepID=UPI001F049A60|nr:ragulator complex protein LAMTOR5 homolog [Xenia sp. Carnegie-2017]
MESELENSVDSLIRVRGVIGVLCVNDEGLALAVEGSASEVHAGIISGIAQEAEKLYPDIDESPVIVLESDTCNLLIRSYENATTGIYKVPS